MIAFIVHSNQVVSMRRAEPLGDVEAAARDLLARVQRAAPCVYETDGRRHVVQRADERWTRRFRSFFARFG